MCDIIDKVKDITSEYISILSIEDAMNLGIHSGPGNGTGDRPTICKLFYVTYIYGGNREPKSYPIESDLSDWNEKIEEFKTNRKLEKGNENGVVGFIIHGINNDKKIKRPIRKDIKQYHKQFNCVFCDASKTICDHKSDLYNDKRVLNTKTQTKDDFQSVCNSCNLRKRAVCIKTRMTKTRYGATNIPHLKPFGIDFISGDETYDKNDPNALVGTYWYDPVAFMEGVYQKLTETKLSESEE
jgi:hypothetical protein